ncbi:LOW QUALITY PROTEIN: KAT8 regulatory NSL complex subunit 1-like protein [Trematomus bernacchii]|uniref:LOW QUALITY PROTEIN: KAT8 regulatory NSL complex subunit 1-like protein n=1 Tax=Trematomus bernacchii TaxID=40690 RepID=UPI00146DDD8E|nr:LOW QUALITY PROTEIN: KAT8 regulatory NSL complex subunit 1-like protein [Trematomus bernacchii]
MAPALTKTLKDGHGIHLSSPPASVRMDSDGRVMCSSELESQMGLTDDGDLQKMWLNLSLFPSLDLCLPLSPLEFPANPVLSPCLQASAKQCETELLPSPASLLSLLSFPKGLRDSHQVACVFPGVPDMFLVPVPEHNGQEACLLHGAAPEYGPGGGDVQHSPFMRSVPPSYCHGESGSQGYTPYFALQPTLSQGRVTPMGCPSASSVQPCNCRVNSDQLAPRAGKEQLCRQAGLQSRAQRLQRRLQALLGEHALQHCDQQLEGLKKHCQISGVSLDSSDSLNSFILPPQVGSDPYCSWLDSPTASFSFSELREFSCSSQALLRGLQEALDSEATASSSSDEEGEEVRIHTKKKTSPVSSSSSSSSCERRWLEQRAELGSRWSWLQLRLAELEGRTQQLVELHKHIRSCKGGVVLAESQPLTDRQIQQTLLRELAGLSCTAGSDADNEPCSPTRLLYNIERQSAQLSQIVNSLMPPLSFSPLSKQTSHTWRGKKAFTSGQREGDIFVPGSSKRRRLGTRRLFKSDVSCVCARTRPLVTYHKPKLFSFNTCNSSSAEDSGRSTCTHSSSLSSPSCSCCSSCDPVVLCSDPACSSSRALSSRTPSSNPHPAVSLSFGTPQSNQSEKSREEWSLRPLIINVEPCSPSHYNRSSSTPLHNSHKYKQRARHHKSRVMGLSPIRMAGSAQSQHRRANQRKRKRKHNHRLLEDEKDDLYQLYDLDSSDEVLEDSYTQAPHKQASRGCVRRRQGESVYNINNIVIPMSLAKVEKLQYKDILTPSWRVVDPFSLNCEAEKEEDKEEGQEEDNNNNVVARRHMELEQREKLRWPSWAKIKCCRRPNSRLSGGGMCTSGEESSAELSCAQLLDTDEQQSPEEWLPQTPWEPREFPLEKDEEDALLSDNLEEVARRSECNSTPTAAKNSNSHLSPASCSGITLPSGGQSQSS